MDWGTIPEIAQHFAAVASTLYHHIPAFVPHGMDESAQNVWTALVIPGAMPFRQKAFQALKFTAATATLGASVVTENISGITTSLIADGEVLLELDRAGEIYRKSHPKINPPVGGGIQGGVSP